MVLRKSFYIRWSAGRSPRVHEVNPGRDPSKYKFKLNVNECNPDFSFISYTININFERVNDLINYILFNFLYLYLKKNLFYLYF